MSVIAVKSSGAGEVEPRRRPPKACVVMLPVWGAAFVRRFLEFSLPTLLAAGNVPALVQELPTRFVLLTRSADMGVIRTHPAWQHLAKICATEMQAIDDLIVYGNHHATVTLAYARVIRASGDDALETAFLFLVGDYLVAEGSLGTVLKRIRSGASAVLAGNLQVAVDVAAAFVRAQPRAHETALALSPRPMVAWALAHLHPDCAASVVNASFLHQSETNRLFWSVDKGTMIGRFYLLHMIGVRPEVGEFAVDGPCDYAFVPELCPSNNVDVLTDSDDYCVVEMQPLRQAIRALRWGPMDASLIARDLSQWTASGHRQNADRTLIFHSGAIPGNVAESIAVASTFIQDIAKDLTPHPKSHRGHPSWTGMMAVQRAMGGLAPGDKEWVRLFGATAEKFTLAGLLWQLRLRMLGHPPAVTPWHPRWPDFQMARASIKSRLMATGRLLAVSPSPRQVEQWLAPLGVSVVGVETDALREFMPENAEPFDACLWMVTGGEPSTDQLTIDGALRVLKPGGLLVVFAAEALEGSHADIRTFCASLGLALRQSGFQLEEAHYVPMGPIRIALHRAMARSMRASRQSSIVLRLLALVASALSAAAVLLCNLVIWSRPSSRPPRRDCSSILLAARAAAILKPK